MSLATAGALSDLTAITKTQYSKEKIHDVSTRAHPLYADMRKVGGWVGDGNHRVAILTSKPQGIATTLAKAQSSATVSKQKQWVLTQNDKYGVLNLEPRLFHMISKDEGAFLDAFKLQVDGILEQFGADLARDLYGSGTGSIGQCSNNPTDAGGPITLINPDDIRNFYEGMTIAANDTEDSTTMRSGTGVVTAIDWDAGTVAYTGTITGITTNDYLFRDGDETGTLKGLAAWLPITAPSATTFFGVDRTANIAGLSGWRKDASNESLEDALLTISAKAKRMNANTTRLYANPLVVAGMMKKAGSKVFRDQGGEVKIGFTGVRAYLMSGTAEVVADPDCPPDRLYGLDMSTWFIKYAGPGFPHFVEEDDLMWLRGASTDAFESRMRSWGQLACTCPGRNFVVKVNSQYSS